MTVQCHSSRGVGSNNDFVQLWETANHTGWETWENSAKQFGGQLCRNETSECGKKRLLFVRLQDIDNTSF